MDLVVFENNKPFVIDEFREGRFDYVELASDVAETKFFLFLFSQDAVEWWPACGCCGATSRKPRHCGRWWTRLWRLPAGA